MQQMNIQPFTIEESPPARARRRVAFEIPKWRKPRGRKKKIEKPTAQLLVKIGVCALACALILGMKALNIPGTEPVTAGVKSALNKESDLDEMLGKLKFVQLPDTLDVFSGDSKLTVPVNAPTAYVEPDAQVVVWENAPDAVVKAAADGTRARHRLGQRFGPIRAACPQGGIWKPSITGWRPSAWKKVSPCASTIR